MKNRPQLKRSLGLRRPVYRTLQGWALGILIDQGAVVECDYHGHRIDRARGAEPSPGRGLAEPVPRCQPANLHCRNGRHHALDRRHLSGVLIQDSTSQARRLY